MVRVTRDDGSITFRGAMPHPRAVREAAAWTDSFPTYKAEILPAVDVIDEVRAWAKATRDGGRYFPDRVSN